MSNRASVASTDDMRRIYQVSGQYRTVLAEVAVERWRARTLMAGACVGARAVVEADHVTTVVRCVHVAYTTDVIVELVADVHLSHTHARTHVYISATSNVSRWPWAWPLTQGL